MRRSLAVALVMILALPLAAQGLTLPSSGQRAPEFTLTTPEGQEVGTETLSGRYVLIVFFASYCTECRERLEKFAGEWASCPTRSSVTVLLIGAGGAESANAEFARSLGWSDWIFAQDTDDVWKRFGVRYLGSWVLIGPDWVVLASGEGEIDVSLICRLIQPSLKWSESKGLALYGNWVDRKAAEDLAVALNLTPTTTKALSGFIVVVGGPVANPAAEEILTETGISFQVSTGLISLLLPDGSSVNVTGSDWSTRDYAVVFTLKKDAVVYVGVMGCTRYGTQAASAWLASNPNAVKSGVGWLLLWEDSSGDRVVQLDEVLVVSTFPLAMSQSESGS